MEGIVLRPSLLQRLSRFVTSAMAPTKAVTATAVTPASATWVTRLGGGQIGQSVGGLMDAILLAVPKKRTTHSKKRLRMTHKYLQTNNTMIQCEICDRWKRPHNYCSPKCIGRRGEEV